MIKIVDLSMEGRARYDYRVHRTQWTYFGRFHLVATSILVLREGLPLPLGSYRYHYENGHLIVREECPDGEHGIYNDDPLPANANEDPYDTIKRGIKYFARGLYGEY